MRFHLRARGVSQQRNGRLVRHYFVIFAIVVGTGLLSSGIVDIYFRYRDSRNTLDLIQQEVAAGAAFKAQQFLKQIEMALRIAAKSPEIARNGLSETFKAELTRLVLVIPAIEDVAAADLTGQIRVYESRFRTVVSSDPSALPPLAALDAAARGSVFVGPVYFVRGSEPYTSVAVPIERFAGEVIGLLWAKVNLKYISEVVKQIKAGTAGYAYIVTRSGDLVAHPNLSLVLRRQNISHLPQVQAASTRNANSESYRSLVAESIDGANVFATYATIPDLDWIVIIERPLKEIYAALHTSVLGTSSALLLGLGMAILASGYLARRIIRPLESLRRGVAKIAQGDLDHRLDLKTGDEIETLAEEFNRMSRALQEAYSDLEEKIASRTKELAQTVQELKALGEISQTIGSTLDLPTVLASIVSHAVILSGGDGGALCEYDDKTGQFLLRATYHLSDELVKAIENVTVPIGRTVMGRTIATGESVQIPDVLAEPDHPLIDVLDRMGTRALLGVPLVRQGKTIGALAVGRKEPGEFPKRTVDLLQALASASVMAIQNARLFQDVANQRSQLEDANQKLQDLDKLKSAFVSNVSHELRTPLTAIESLAENMLDGITGPLSKQQATYIADIKTSADRLARLIDNVLDLSVIESGKLELARARFSLMPLVNRVVDTLRPMATDKRIVLETVNAADELYVWADRDKIIQVVTNLIGNAVKFTPPGGRVRVHTRRAGAAWAEIAVSDTGPGIPLDERHNIFEEFYQVRQEDKRKSRGAGLGLAISKKLVEMHGGRIWVETAGGNGSTFVFSIPGEEMSDPEALPVQEKGCLSRTVRIADV